MDSYTTGLERALAGNRMDIAGQSIYRVQRGIHQLRGVIIPLHQAGHGEEGLSESNIALLRAARAERRDLHAKNHELHRILEAGAPSPELEIATQGIWNWGITRIVDSPAVDST